MIIDTVQSVHDKIFWRVRSSRYFDLKARIENNNIIFQDCCWGTLKLIDYLTYIYFSFFLNQVSTRSSS